MANDKCDDNEMKNMTSASWMDGGKSIFVRLLYVPVNSYGHVGTSPPICGTFSRT